MNRLLHFVLIPFLALAHAALAETKLYMAEEDGCMWCARWHEEIGHIYPKTVEGRAAPLQSYDLQNETLENVNLKTSVHFTPTFILVQDGQEVGRLEGYPGEDFFWGLLGMMFRDANIPLDETG